MTGVRELEPVVGMNNKVTAGHVDEGLRILYDARNGFHNFRHGGVKWDLGLQTTFGHCGYHG